MRIILGSESPRRREIFRSIVPPGCTPEFVSHGIDEDAIEADGAPALTLAIALAKNRGICERIDEPAIVVTADSLVMFPATDVRGIRGKPAGPDQAKSWLRDYRMGPVACVTSVVVTSLAHGHPKWAGSFTDSASVLFRDLDDDFIDLLVSEGTVLGCAGAFMVEHPLFEGRIVGFDGNPQTIQGLPGELTRQFIIHSVGD